MAALHHPTKYLCIMVYTDSSSALRWLHKASFDPVKQEAHNNVARRLARFLMCNELALYSQHIPGKQNIIADSLALDMRIIDNKLTILLNNLFPHQTQKNLHLRALPNDIICWLSSLKDMPTNCKDYHVELTPSSLGNLINGDNSSQVAVSKMNS